MKEKLIRSAIPIYIAAAVWVLYGMVLPLYQIAHLLMAAGLSVVGYLAGTKFFPGRKVKIEATSGDAAVDAQLTQCRADLKSIQAANDGIASPAISAQISRIEAAGAKILDSVAAKKDRAQQVRKFMNYYLPTTSKLLSQYKTLADLGASGESIQKAMTSVSSSLNLIAGAFEKQLDNLYKDEAMDMTSDVQVLETMMSGDGLTDAGIQNVITANSLQTNLQQANIQQQTTTTSK